MNSKNIISIVMIIAGITLNFSFENEGIDFLTGLLIGGGVGLLFTSKFKSKAVQ
ncbi:hypothetical protein QYS49_37700 [Marivirga salinae]|uniref:Uncharacterized protein n=1 Tax=Marivirga salinarum TaxID=3059078 RepID=A0AA51NCV8_9BACT|nr:hypothetical protein [Marivirga sp. BDSF4-3]WMN11246.1 hypothetical protein QYS49_37700 [Marivirga sp. BDSF4-3]